MIKFWFQSLLYLTIISSILCCAIGCPLQERPTLVITFVLPDDLIGEVLVERDSQNGKEYKITHNKETGNDEVTLKFDELNRDPLYCKLRLKDTDLFHRWRKYIVKFENGTVLYDHKKDFRKPGYLWKGLGYTLGEQYLDNSTEIGGSHLDGSMHRWELKRVPQGEVEDKPKSSNNLTGEGDSP